MEGSRRFRNCLLVVLAVALGCDHDRSPTAPTEPPPPSVAFVSSFDGSGDAVYLQAGPPRPGLSDLSLELRVSELQKRSGIHFDLRYPTQQLRYVGFEDAPGPGSMGNFGPVGGLTGVLRGLSKPLDSGSSHLITIFFQAVGQGSGDFRWEGQGSVDPEHGKRFGDLNWFDATVEVELPG